MLSLQAWTRVHHQNCMQDIRCGGYKRGCLNWGDGGSVDKMEIMRFVLALEEKMAQIQSDDMR